MRVLAACSLGGVGHLQPLLPFATAAAGRGDAVRLLVPSVLEDAAAGSGLPYEVGGSPPDDAVAAIREQLPTAPRHEVVVLTERELFGRMCTAALLPAAESLAAGWRPDLVLREPTEYASAVVAHRLGLPMATVAISTAEAEWGAGDLVAPVLEPLADGVVAGMRAAPFLSRFPASLDPSPWPDTRRYRLEVQGSGRPLPDWWGGAGGPLVYVSFGTVVGHMAIAAGVYREALAAAALIPARVLLTVGSKVDPASLGVPPPNVHVEQWVPQADVLAHADLVVCHGGSGTVYGALGAGVPVVVVPLFADQGTNGRLVADGGAGLVVQPARGRGGLFPEDAPTIAAAAAAVLADGSYRATAARIGAEMAAAQPPEETLASLQ